MALSQSDLLRLMESLRTADGVELVRVLAQRILQELIEAEATAVIGAEAGEHTPDRTTWRNGHRDRLLTTQAGDLELKLPKLRSGSFFPSLLERRRRIDQALFAVVMEAYVHGVSTRSVDDLVKAMGMEGISKSRVSRLCTEIDERVQSFLTRPIEGDWPYLWLDATYVKARRDRHIVSVAVIIAVGVNTDGRRESLPSGLTRGCSA